MVFPLHLLAADMQALVCDIAAERAIDPNEIRWGVIDAESAVQLWHNECKLAYLARAHSGRPVIIMEEGSE